MSKLIEFIQRVLLFIRVMVGATRSNYRHRRARGRSGRWQHPLSWMRAIPHRDIWPTLWGITHSYGQMDAAICWSSSYEVGEGEWETEWTKMNDDGSIITVFMATKEWRDQGVSPGIVQWNPHKYIGAGYYLGWNLYGVILPLPWLWGTIIPHPDTLLSEKAEVKAEEDKVREQRNAGRNAGLVREPSSRSSRAKGFI